MKKKIKKIITAILTFEAKMVLYRWNPKIIAVTGNVGKTSTKDAIYTIFSKLSTAQKSQKSFNSDIGVPLTILGLKNAWNNPIFWTINIIIGFFTAIFKVRNEKWLILEIGADRPNDIKNITKWIKPDITVINKIGDTPVHVEYFGSAEALAKEKSFLAKALKPNGVLVAYADDEKTKKIANEQSPKKVLTFGFSDDADVLASNYNLSYKEKNGITIPSGISFKVNYEGNSLPIIIEGALGRQQAYPALSAISVAIVAKLNVIEAINALRGHATPPGRMRLVEGVKNTLIIDDSYNSSPVAQKEALLTLKEIKTSNGGRKFAVLGDMRELGEYSTEAHKEIGKEASLSCDILCTVGELGKIISESALDYEMSEKNIYQYDTSDEAGKDIQNMIREGDVILVKGSQAVRMEKIVKEIMAEPEKAENLLVRQEKEWQIR